MASFHGSANPKKGFSSQQAPFLATLDFIVSSATSLANKGKNEEITTLFENSIQKAKGHPHHLKELLIRIKEFYTNSSQHCEVIKYLLKLEEILDPDNDGELLANTICEKEKIYISLGDAYLGKQQFEEAIDYFMKALVVNKTTRDKTTERSCYVMLGEAYFLQKKFGKAAEYFEKNYRLLTNSNPSLTATVSDSPQLIAIDYLTKLLNMFTARNNRIEAGKVYLALGNVYFMLKEYKKAEKNFNEAVAIFEGSKGQEESSSLIGLGNVLHVGMNNPSDAIKSYEKALNIGIENRDVATQIKANGSLGSVYISTGHYKKANEFCLESLRLATNSSDQLLLANIYENLGTSYLRLGNYREAITFYKKVLLINEKIGIRQNVGITYGNLATVYTRLHQHAEAIEYLEKCLSIALEFGDSTQEAQAYGNLGGVHFQRGELQKAIDYHEKQVRICRKIDYPAGLANAYSNMANAYKIMGYVQKAIDLYNKGIEIFKQLNDLASLGSSFTNLGIVYESLGRFKFAIDLYKEGLKVGIEAGDRPGECNTYCHLGNAYYSLEKYEEAIHYYNKHHDISVELEDLMGKGVAMANLANVYREKGEFKKAITYCKQALDITLTVGKPAEIVMQYSNLAATHCKLGDYETAVNYFKKGRDVSLEMGNKVHEASCNASIGICNLVIVINANTDNKTIKTTLSQASSLLKKSIRSMDKLFSELVVDENQTSAFNQYYQWHVYLAWNYIMLQKPIAGLLILDLGKSKALQLLIEQRAIPAKEHSSRDSYREGTWEMIETDKADERVKHLAKLLQIQQNDATVLVYAFDFQNTLHIWVINKDGGVQHSVQKNAKDRLMKWTDCVSGDVRGLYSFFNFSNAENLHVDDVAQRTAHSNQWAWYQDLITSNARQHARSPAESDTAVTDVQDAQKRLYQALIGPGKSLIKGTKLIIIPDNFLFFVPFCSLLDESGRPLVDSHSIQMTPSMHTLASSVLLSNEQSEAGPGPALFIGNPSVGKISFRGQSLQVKSLPAAGEEAKSLATKFYATALVEDQATKTRVLERVSNASIVHIAAHGDSVNGEIFLAPNPEVRSRESLPCEKSYLLRQGDVIARKVTARLVVLSCCHTGRGNVTSEGVLGLARAFLAAGARAVLVALWRLPDKDTKVFMELFYDGICNEKTACVALKASMDIFRQSSNDNRRSFRVWAPFTIFGEDVKFTKRDIDIIKEESRKMP